MAGKEGVYTQVWPVGGGTSALTTGFVAGDPFDSWAWDNADLLIDITNKGSVTRLDIQLELTQTQASTLWGNLLDTSSIAGGIVTLSALEWRLDITAPAAPLQRTLRIPLAGVRGRINLKCGVGVVTGSLFAAWVRKWNVGGP